MALAETRERNASVRAAADPLDTFPKLLFEHAAKRGARPAFREKDYGIWQSWSWAEAAREIEEFAAGLAGLGFKRGDKLAVAGDNRPRLYWAISAAQCLGGVPVPVYQDSVAAEMKFVLDHAEARFAVAENQAGQVAAVLGSDAEIGIDTGSGHPCPQAGQAGGPGGPIGGRPARPVGRRRRSGEVGGEGQRCALDHEPYFWMSAWCSG